MRYADPEAQAEIDRLTAEVERLRRQSKDSSDAWTRRVADLQHYHDSWENLRRMAHRYLSTNPDGPYRIGYSQIQEAHVAELLHQRDLLAARLAEIEDVRQG